MHLSFNTIISHMRFIFCSFLFSFLFVFTTNSLAQIDTISEHGPIGGLDVLVNLYYDIEFTKEQRDLLRGKEIEFIFTVDSIGTATLDIINGITDADILDSFRLASQTLPPFHPLKDDYSWFKYFLKIQFPTYNGLNNIVFYEYNKKFAKTKYADFEMIDVPGSGFEFVLGATTNTYLGKPQKYLQPGFGFNM